MRKQINPHFREFLFDWNCRQYLLVGGFGSGKSYHAALKVILKLLSERRTALVVRATFESIRDSCFALFMEIVAEMQLETHIKCTRSPMQMNFMNGSKIIFRGLDKPERLRSIHDVSLVWIEEAAEITYDAFKELQGRLRHPSLPLHTILSLNPTSKANWVYKHFFERVRINDEKLYEARSLREGGVFYLHSTADDNFFLPKNYIATLDEMADYDYDRFRIGRLGRFGLTGTKVFPQAEKIPHDDAICKVAQLPRRLKFIGLDFGFVTSYNAVVMCAVNDTKQLYIYWEFYERNLTDDVFADKLLGCELDGVIRCDSAEPKAIAYLQKRGLRAIAARKWSGSRHARLDSVRKIKRFKRIFISDACPNCWREIGELTYKIDRDGQIIEDEFSVDAHCLDAVRYALDAYDVADVKRLSRSDLGL